ncbi:MAG: hypothetical protein Q8P48_03050, partial [Deltaproteobacteria bacterium]|nr:hypothetical protein [Deltaproteobacteria bacterium]
IVSVRTAFGRSAFDHVLQFYGFVTLLLCMLVSKRILETGLNRWLKAAAVIAIFTFFNFRSGSFADVNLPSNRTRVMNAAVLLSEYGDAAPVQCSGGLFSRRNLDNRAFFYYDLGICEIKKALKTFDVRDGELLVTHSASLIYPSLGYRLPTKYYCLGWAITEDMQQDLISELERSGIKAVLKVKQVRGIVALTEYDIPDEVRLPVYSGWLAKNFDLENPVRTSLGDIYLRRDIAAR